MGKNEHMKQNKIDFDWFWAKYRTLKFRNLSCFAVIVNITFNFSVKSLGT